MDLEVQALGIDHHHFEVSIKTIMSVPSLIRVSHIIPLLTMMASYATFVCHREFTLFPLTVGCARLSSWDKS